jgi:hypothetical protein
MPYTLTRVTITSSKLYNQDRSSTINRYKNGESAYIYSKQQQQQNQDVALNTLRLHGF